MDGKTLIAQRSESMTNALKWEFPGGKIMDNETEFEAIQRECNEELSVQLTPIRIGNSIRHTYPHINIELIPIFCSLNNQTIQLNEHVEYRFIPSKQLKEFDFSMADIKIIEANNLTK